VVDSLPPTERVVGTPDPEGGPEPRPVPRPASRQIGPYRLVKLLGEGGMGEVWRAEQTAPVRRTVALKLIKRGMDTRRVISRFQAERQALAMMDHPAIATVFDAGETDRGRPYFVMEYVRGVPVTEYCDRHRLTTRQRLDLFCRVCEGVQHAHQKAVIHRDLKPSNILVAELEGKPTPKIIDFGVAKAIAQPLTEQTMFTQLGQVIGTPEYMSPEQADLTGEDVDTRTDVYALGVVLYQLLVGALPFDPKELRKSGLESIRRMLREKDPERPSTRLNGLGEASVTAASNRGTERPALVRQLSGDLDWIVMKALEKDRSRRYGSPNELAADIGRYLHDEPVLARPPSAGYRLSKFARRHRTGVSVAAALLVLLIAFAVAMAVQAERIASERDSKEQALAEAEAVTGFLSDMLASVKPGQERRNVTVREVLDSAKGKLDDTFADRPAVASRLQATIGSSYRALGLYPEAEQELRTAYETRQRVLGPDNPDTLMTGFELANTFYNRGRYTEAEGLYREVLAARRRVLGDDDSQTLWSICNLAGALLAEERYNEAVPLLQEALAARRRTLGVDHSETLVVMNNLAAAYQNLGRYSEAEPLYREALAVSEKIRGPKHPQTLAYRSNLGELFADEGHLSEAEPLLAQVVVEKKEVFGADHPSTLYTAGVLARVYLDEGKLDAAAPLLRDTLDGDRNRLGPAHEQTLGVQLELAELDRRAGRLVDADALLASTLASVRAAFGPHHRLTASVLHEQACLRASQGRRDDAIDLLGQSLDAAPPFTDPFTDSALRPLRGDSRFEALRERWERKSKPG
jgi:eukaryotic-like serine/threonine-protein kinase